MLVSIFARMGISLHPDYVHFFLVFEALPIIFVEKRHFTVGQVGLVFIGVGIGSTVGALLNIYFTSHYPKLIKKWKGFPPPEERLFGAMLAGPCLVVGSFWLGWTGEYASIAWWIPALSTILIGVSVNLVFISFLASFSPSSPVCSLCLSSFFLRCFRVISWIRICEFLDASTMSTCLLIGIPS
jgi:MFS transporter, DHA1 family, multidrug resistance protein